MSIKSINTEIKVLSESMINKISAGEVIERPASIVKELVENSIDSGAKNITVEIKNGGISFIRVTDDGTGIEHKQVPMAFVNHATSKINIFEDFDSLNTLGFRGEALCTIAAISRVEMTTRFQNEDLGTNIKIHGGKIIEQKEISFNRGTTIICRDIFFNTPARFKFLKKPSVEATHISNLMNRFALSHPDISFEFINNQNLIFTTNGNGDLKSVSVKTMGKEIINNIFDVRNELNKIKLFGFVSKPCYSRGNRNQQNFFVNGRWVKNNIVISAVENAYKSRIITGRFPVYVLNLIINPDLIDVNVHPAKTEIRFADENLMYNFIFKSISEVFKISPQVGSREIFVPRTNSETNPESLTKAYSMSKINKTGFDEKNRLVLKEDKAEFENYVFVREDYDNTDERKENKKNAYGDIYLEKNNVSHEQISLGNINKASEREKNEAVQETIKIPDDYKIIGCVFSTYWIIEAQNKIFIIDQHAAHERILFEEFKEKYESKNISSQQLLDPIEIGLADYETEVLINNLNKIKDMGFDIKHDSKNKFIIKGVPDNLNKYMTKELFLDIVDSFENPEFSQTYDQTCDKDFDIYKIMQLACKKAVKANDVLSYPEIKAIIKKIMSAKNPFNCPHGRPTFVQITQYEIEKLFGRKI